MRILIAEDDPSLGRFLAKGLQQENYAVDVAVAGHDAQAMADSGQYDLIVLDVMLPERSGFEILEHLRRQKLSVPVLMLSASGRTEDRVRGLDLGADDYVAKPFAFSELTARIRALLRRGSVQEASQLSYGDLVLNRLEHRVTRNGRSIELTPKEFSLLEYLLRHPRHCLSRTVLVEHVWNIAFDSGTNVVDVYISYLRNKVDAEGEPRLIHTVRGVGYQLGVPEDGILGRAHVA